MPVAQAGAEGLVFLGNDGQVRQYPIKTLW